MPDFFYDSDNEPLECVNSAKKAWSDNLKTKLVNFNRKMCKGWIKQRKVQPKPTKKTVQAAVVEADEDIDPAEKSESQQTT